MARTRIDIRHILCPVDFSAESTRALEHAVRVASFFDATVHVLHVVPSLFEAIEPVLLAPRTLRKGLEKVMHQLEAFVGPFREWHVPLAQTVGLGNPAREIEAKAAELPADLIVMGTRGRKGLSHLLLGSVTEKVMHRAACPVLAVGPGQTSPPEAPPYRRILCPTKLVRGSEHAIDFALALAAGSGARLEVLHAIESLPPGADRKHPFEGDPELEGLRTRMIAEADAEIRQSIPAGMRNWCSVSQRIVTGDPAPAIIEAARTGRAEVIVMGVHATAMDRALFGSTIERVLREAPCAVLILRQRGRMRSAARRAVAAEASAPPH